MEPDISKSMAKKTSVSTVAESIVSLDDDEMDEVFGKPTAASASHSGKLKERNAYVDVLIELSYESFFRLAKKYAEQNAKLKQRLKEVKSNYVSLLEKNRKKGEEFVKQNENSKAG